MLISPFPPPLPSNRSGTYGLAVPMSPLTSSYTALRRLLSIFLLSDKALCEVKAKVDSDDMLVLLGDNYRLIGMLPLDDLKQLRHAWVDQSSHDGPEIISPMDKAVGGARLPTPRKAEDDKPGGDSDVTRNAVRTFALVAPCLIRMTVLRHKSTSAA
jgi:hypothetical protein